MTTVKIADYKATTPANTIAIPKDIAVYQSPKKQHPQKEEPENMETSTNLKRKRDSSDTNKEGEKKC